MIEERLNKFPPRLQLNSVAPKKLQKVLHCRLELWRNLVVVESNPNTLVLDYMSNVIGAFG